MGLFNGWLTSTTPHWAVSRYDVMVVGAGIIGLAHAYEWAKAGKRVLVCERSPQAVGASVRNFGMVWTIGQPPGELREIAVESNRIWREVLAASGLWNNPAGCLTLAYHADEWAVLEEFHQKGAAHGYQTELLTPSEVARHSPVVRTEGLIGALYSPQEIAVDPREVIAGLPPYLAKVHGVEFRWSTLVTRHGGQFFAAGEPVEADRVEICTGDDYESLYPELFKDSGLNRCKLQMLRAEPAESSWRIGPHLCAGLTLAHYANFRICDSLVAVKDRFQREMPEYVEHGIHLLVSQNGHGTVTIGDTHEYGLAQTPFLRDDLELLVLAYLNTFLDVGQLDITERWHGIYSTYSGGPFFEQFPDPGVHVLTGVGGSGMTMGFGYGARSVRHAGQ